MAAPQTPPLASVLLLAFFVLHPSSSLPPCPQSCICKSTLLLNCSSSSLFMVPRFLQYSVAELDLSHNLLSSLVLHQPHPNLRNVWLGNNSITYLSLCIETNLKDPHLRHHLRTQSRNGCQVWGPALQLLSAERNLLEQLPEGLGGVRSLKVLQLSFNRISTLKPGVLSHLRQLKELHLQHNLITHLYPQTFQDLDQLRVLDLRFNTLASLHPLMYLTLSTIGTDVQLDGNRWQCNCMRSLQRRMAYDSSRGLQVWSIVCAFPSRVLGRDLLQLQEEDFNCLGTENRQDLHQDVTVYSGSEILLSCHAQDSVLWTPSGKGSVSQQNAGLLISDVSDSNSGLYVCVSEENQVVSVFNLQISKRGGARKARSLPKSHSSSPPQNTVNRVGEVKTQYTESDLALAVCLSVFITFLLAFIVGVLARPLIDMLCKRIAKKKSPTATSTEQRPYDNEAFSDGEEQEGPGPFRERRVTFSTVDFIEDSNEQSYDVASGDQERISSDAVIKCEGGEAEPYDQTAGDSGSEHLCHRSLENKQSCDRGTGDSNEKSIHHKEFEHIPDRSELEERRSMSSCSDSSFSEKIRRPTYVGRNSPQLAEDSVQQRADFSTKTEVTQISMEGKNEIIGISSGPSLHTKVKKSLDSDNEDCDNEELFEFSDSAESPSVGSRVFDSYNNLQQSQESTSDKQKMEDMSSSSSYISEDEPTHYNVNSDRDIDQGGNYDSSSSSDSENETICYMKQQGRDEVHMTRPPSKESQTVTNVPENQWPSVILGQKIRIKRRLDIKAPSQSSDSSSSNENGDDAKSCMKKQEQKVLHMSRPPIKVSQTVKQENQWPTVDFGKVTRFKRCLDVKAPSMSSDSSSSSDSEDSAKGYIKELGQEEAHMTRTPSKASQTVTKMPKNQWPTVDLGQKRRIKRRLNIKAPSQSSDSISSSNSEDETTDNVKKQEQAEVHMSRHSINVPQTVIIEPGNQWPIVNLEQLTQVKRRIDIKASSQSYDSSSNKDGGGEAKGHVVKQEQEKVHMSRPPIKVSQMVTELSENQWPSVDLVQVTQIKRHLAFKAPSPRFDLSPNSESENETTGPIQKQGQEDVYISRHPGKLSQTMAKENPENQWPTVALGRIMIKRRLDIKAPRPIADSSSGSDSEDEITGHIQKKGDEEVHISQPPVKISDTVTGEPYSKWPTVDFGRLPQIKRRLDIKGPSQGLDSSSSRESKDETKSLILKQEHDEVQITNPPIKVSQCQTLTKVLEKQWPVVDIEQITQIKRRLDFKGPSPSSGSSSNSHNNDDTKGYIKEQKEEEVHISRSPIKVSKVPENYWPTVGLEQIKIKRRLDIKPPSQSSDSSSSNESDEETKSHSKNQEQEVLQMSRPPIKLSQTITNVPENQWPTVHLGRVTQVKRRLDFKELSQSSGLSSSSHTDDETKGCTQRLEQEEVHLPRSPIKASQTLTKVPENQWPTIGLGQIKIKRRLDVKAPSSISNSSSSSDKEDETKIHTHGQDQVREHTVLPPMKVPQTLAKIPEKKWPTVDLEQITQIKRRLDFKGPSLSSGSSSSSHSTDETKGYIKEQKEEKVHISRSPIKVSTVTKLPENYWPTVGLEQIKIKRRLDIKPPSQSSDSSSNNESDEETKSHSKNQEQEVLQMSRPPIKLSQTITNVPENQWPTIGLGQIKIKRRLDVKAPSSISNSSSSSDKEDETKIHTHGQDQVREQTVLPPMKVPQTLAKIPEKQWPTVDLEQITQIKRRLDFKGPSLISGSSSSSHIMDETKGYIKEQKEEEVHISRSPIKVSTVTKLPENYWPTVGLEQIKIKRRLDIKAPFQSSDSSSINKSDNQTKSHLKSQEQEVLHMSKPPINVSQTMTKVPENHWPAIGLEQIKIRRRLDIKAPTQCSDSSFTSDNEDVTKTHIKTQEQKDLHQQSSTIKVSQTVIKVHENQWPTVDFGQVTQIKRRLDFKAPTPGSDSSSSSEQGIGMIISSIKASQSVTKVSENQWPVVDLEDVTQIKRHLDFKAPPPWSPSSRRESENEDKDLQARVKMDYSALSTTSENNVKSLDAPVMNIFHTPRKDYNIKLEKYSVIPDHLENKPTNDTIDVTPDINPELQTRWATMNLGISRFRKRLEITPSTTEPHSLSSPYSEHSSNTETRPESRPRLHRKNVEMQGKDSSPVLENKAQNVSITLKDPYPKYTSLGNKEPNVTEGQKTELDTMLSGFGSQRTERYEDIWVGEKASTTTSQQQPYTFSKTDIKRSVPDLSIGVPRIQRRLDIKAPSLESSYASSFINKSEKNVKEYSKMQSRQISPVQETTDDLLITYKRSIIKQSSPLPWNSFPPRDRSQTAFVTLEDDRNASLVPRTGKSVSFDHIVKNKIRQSRSNTDEDLPDEIRWTGVGHHLSDLSEASLNATTVAQPLSPPHGISSSTSVVHKMQDNGKSDVTLMSKHSSPDTKGVSYSSSDSLDMFGVSPLRANETTETVSEDRQNRGLGALKAMSLERKLWETDYGKNPSASSDGLQDDTKFDYGLSKRGIDVLPKEPVEHLPSASVEKRKDADLLLLLYGVPRYKGHGIKNLLQEAPPPLPETPPPDD
ncbi:uncharacterized protein [Nothobranchius furzeri]